MMLTQRSANPRLQLDELKVAAHQFQSAVGSELLVTELDRKLLLDRLPQPPYLQPHLWGLSCCLSCVAAALQMTRQRPLFFDQIVESTRFNFGLRLRSPAISIIEPKIALGIERSPDLLLVPFSINSRHLSSSGSDGIFGRNRSLRKNTQVNWEMQLASASVSSR